MQNCLRVPMLGQEGVLIAHGPDLGFALLTVKASDRECLEDFIEMAGRRLDL